MREIDQAKEIGIQPALQTDLTFATLYKQWLSWWESRSLLQKLLPLVFLAGFWGLHMGLGGFRIDHLAVGLLALAYYGGPRTVSLFRFFLPFTLYLVLYDSQGYYAEWLRGDIRVAEPYQFDKTFFGIETSEGRLLPSQWLQNHTHPFLDVVTGLSYIIFIPVFLVVGLFFRFGLERMNDPAASGRGIRQRFSFKTVASHGELNPLVGLNNRSADAKEIHTKSHALMWSMFWLNIICCSTYYWYPAAPPWYVDIYGLGPAQLDAIPSAAGALRFDAILGVNLFADLYAKCPNVFGAIPSLHVAFPLLSVYFAFKLKSLRIFCLGFYLLIAFSAVYLNHHYIIDILWGSAYALLVAWSMDTYYRSKPTTQLTR